MSTSVAPAEKPARSPQLGSFTVVERLDNAGAPKGHVTLRVVGNEESPFSGQAGVATCFAAPPDDEARATASELATKLSNLRHPALVPVLDARLSGNVSFWVAPAEAGERLPDLNPQTLLPFWTTASIVGAAAGGLQAAHDAGLSHGSLTIASIVAPSPGMYAVTGVGLTGRGPAQDQHDLGEIAIALLSGRRWNAEASAEAVTIEDRLARAQRLREWMSGVTERVVNVVVRATEPNPADRFGSVSEFASQFADAVLLSGEDLVHGAFEAISGRNVELARLLAAKAALYDPRSEGLTLLNLQIQGGSPFGAFPGTTSQHQLVAADASNVQMLTLPPLAPAGEQPGAIPPQLTQGLPPEYLEMIATQFEVKTVKRGINPIFVLIIGGVVVVFLLLVAALATMMLSGN